MVNYVVTALRENPELAIFLTLAIGFFAGNIRVGSFKLGNVVGTLFAGVLVGVVRGLTVYIYPPAAEPSMYLQLVLVLLFRPRGLMGERFEKFE